MKVLVPNIFIVKEKSVLIELHHAQNTLIFIDNEKGLDPFKTILSETIAIDTFSNETLEMAIFSEAIVLHFDLHGDQIQDLRLHLEDL